MNFDYNEEQQLLAASVKRFIDKDYTFEARKKIVASNEGYSHAIWSTFAEIGLLGLPFSPDLGGFGGGAVDLMSVMEAIGEALVVEPYLSTVGLGAQFVARAGTNARQHAILPLVSAGKLKMAFAHTESGARYKLAHIATRAKSTSAGYTISGEKRIVVHAPCADQVIVSARTSGGDTDPEGISVFVVDARAPGVSMAAYRTVDELRAADVVFADVHVPADALLGQEARGLALIEEVVDYATALLCAEAVGAIKYANDATLEYLKTR
ncbi:MAG TPA: acyl-CoA dehydrogenase family protein, partial [Casimicrobiaceae bacterium]|nr:acyl-CoA dehydrogenase family protein [Casimicrobiaceae bacterium]